MLAVVDQRRSGRHNRYPERRPACLLLVIIGLLLAISQNANAQITIMPMGDSVTVGVDYLTNSSGGYRDPLYRHLTGTGISFTFVGANNEAPTPVLTIAAETYHNGFGGWQIQDLNNNLDGVAAPAGGGDGNAGGYLLTGGHGTGRAAMSPDIILLHAGTNDILQGSQTMNRDLYDLITHIHSLSPKTVILVAGLIPINASSLNSAIASYNSYIKNQLVPSLYYTRFVDQNSGFLNPDGSVNGSLLGVDLVHPNRFGYPIIAQNWAVAIEAIEGVTGKNSHQLTTQNGTGSGSYPSGSIVTIGASAAPAGTQFATWTPATQALSNPYSTLTTYTMPAVAATLTANYATLGSPIIPNGTYNLTSYYDGLSAAATAAVDGSAAQQQVLQPNANQLWDLVNLGGNTVSLMLSGTREALEVPISGVGTVGTNLDVLNYMGGSNQQWTVVPFLGTTQLINVGTGQLLNIQGYSTVAGAPLNQYTSGFPTEQWDFYPATGTQTTYSLTVNSGTGGGNYAAGSTVTVVADPPANGYTFAGWTGTTVGMANPSSATTTVITSGSSNTITATYRALPSYPLTVGGGSGSGTYMAGTAVTVSANTAPPGSQFANWTGSTGTLGNVSASTTTLMMPAGPAAVTATYSPSSGGVTSGTNLGAFALLNEGTTQGNSIVINYGRSLEGAGLITYWQFGSTNMNVFSMGSNLYEIVENIGGRCLTSAGSTVTITTCAGSPSQLVALALQSDGSYTIRAGSGNCIEAAGAFSPVGALPCGSSPTQRWNFSGPKPLVLNGGSPTATYPLTVGGGSGGGTYAAGTVVTVSANAAPSGSQFSNWTGSTSTLSNSNAATTTLTMPTGPATVTATYTQSGVGVTSGTNLGAYALLNEGTARGNSMVINYGRSAEGAGLVTYWQSGSPGMNVISMGSNLYEIVENIGGRCLSSIGSTVNITTCAGNPSQLFALTLQSDGSYTILSGSGSCIEASGAFSPIGALPCDSSPTQRWNFNGLKPLALP